tara:strand:- start:530 stop:727 length:198 start_codon:yes stop_codon:yes gene_type:complete
MKIEEIIKQVKTEGTLEEIRNAEPIGYHAKIDGTWYNVPLDDTNRHYIQIHKLVDAGELIIKDAD